MRHLLIVLCVLASLVLPVAGLAQTAPTHFVNSTGACSNTNPGTSSAAPWCNLDPVSKAASTYAGNMTVQVTGPVPAMPANTFLVPPAGNTLTITGDRPAVVATPTVIGGDPWTLYQETNVGTRAQVEPRATDGKSAVYGPAGQGAPDLPATRFGAWTQTSVTTSCGTTVTVWQSPALNGTPGIASWASGRGALPHRIPVWQFPTTTGASAWASAATCPTNAYTAWGLYSDGVSNFLILPPDGSLTNPNQAWVFLDHGTTFGLAINGPDVTVTSLAFQSVHIGLYIREHSVRTHVYGNDFRDFNVAVNVVSLLGAGYSQSHTIEQNRFSDDGNWVLPTATPNPTMLVSWPGYKGSLTYGAATACSCFRNMETAAIKAQGGSNNSVYQDNTVIGGVDGFDHYPTAPGGGHYDANSDARLTVQRNYFEYLSDDALDRTGNQVDLKVLNNRMDYTRTFISLAWTNFGPLTLTGNVAWQTGNAQSPDRSGGTYYFKLGNDTIDAVYTQPQVTVSHNTLWTTQPGAEAINPGGGSGRNMVMLLLDHNIIRQEAGHIIKSDFPYVSEDYNDWSENSPAAGAFVYANGTYDTITAWRSGTGQGAHSNLRNPSLHSVPDPYLVDPVHGDVHVILNGMGY